MMPFIVRVKTGDRCYDMDWDYDKAGEIVVWAAEWMKPGREYSIEIFNNTGQGRRQPWHLAGKLPADIMRAVTETRDRLTLNIGRDIVRAGEDMAQYTAAIKAATTELTRIAAVYEGLEDA